MASKHVDIVLVNCPPWGVINPPLGPAYLAANLTRHGRVAAVFDLNVKLYHLVTAEDRRLWRIANDNDWRKPEHVAELMDRWQPYLATLLDQLVEQSCSSFGFSVIDPNEYFSAACIKLLKERREDATILVGGPACSAPGQREMLAAHSGGNIDYFLVGEGEELLPEFLHHRQHGGLIASLSQVVSGSDPSLPVETLKPAPLETMEWPDFAEFDMSDYSGESLALLWSRGCIGRCVYCKEKALWGRFRVRPVSSIMAELQHHVAKLGITNFVVYDSAVNGNALHLSAICEAIIDAGLKITWSGEAIAHKHTSLNLLKRMKQAGCHTLVFGIESGSDRILRAMGKLSDVATGGEVLRNTSKAGIRVAINILVGFPGETDADFQQTLEFLRSHYRYINRIDSVSTLQVVTDTPLWARIDDFDVVLPEAEPHDKWYTRDGQNSWQVRQQRLKEALRLAGELGFEIGRTFLAETGEVAPRSGWRRCWPFASWFGRRGGREEKDR